jgi:hypothetical protein
VAARTIPDWRAVLDSVAKIDVVGDGPVGYFGTSMGDNIGIRLAAAEAGRHRLVALTSRAVEVVACVS